MIEVGQKAPDFELLDNKGEQVSLSALQGKVVVLFFYPKADTPGCTIEACAFRDSQGSFEEANAVILGVSADNQMDQGLFAKKFNLPFRLLCDTEHTVADAYGTWIEKNNYGKKSMGVRRSTFIVGKDGNIAKIFPKVNVEGHSKEVLEAVTQLS
ncbi:MAG: thioredoxin-dependent thiol peroxidase [Armatimonadota bacterium]|nr:thioredoxin-dependent thiol peroxidase [Armatimonadota bacterium]